MKNTEWSHFTKDVNSDSTERQYSSWLFTSVKAKWQWHEVLKHGTNWKFSTQAFTWSELTVLLSKGSMADVGGVGGRNMPALEMLWESLVQED